MSLPIVVTPSSGADWDTAWEQVEGLRKGGIALSLTNYDATTVPQIASGSWIECAGAIHKATSNQTITGTPSANAINYITMVPSGAGASAILTPTWASGAPTWSDAYQGYYSGTTRYVGGCYYDGTNYLSKWIYGRSDCVSQLAGTSALRSKEIEIGDWDMNAALQHTVAHGLGALWKKFRSMSGIIRNDDDDAYFVIGCSSDGEDVEVAFDGNAANGIDSTNIYLVRQLNGSFDSVDFDDVGGTQETRGWITIWYGA